MDELHDAICDMCRWSSAEESMPAAESALRAHHEEHALLGRVITHERAMAEMQAIFELRAKVAEGTARMRLAT